MKFTWAIWLAFGIVLTLGIQTIGQKAFQGWDNRLGVPAKDVEQIAFKASVEQSGSTDQPIFVLVKVDNPTLRLGVVNSSQPEVKKVLLSTSKTTVFSVEGVIYPKNTSLFYLSELNGQKIASSKQAIAQGKPSVALIVASQPKHAEIATCLKKELGEQFELVYANEFFKLESKIAQQVGECFKENLESPVIDKNSE